MKRAQEEYDGYVKEHMRYKVTIFQLRGGELHYSQGGGVTLFSGGYSCVRRTKCESFLPISIKMTKNS